MTSLQGIDSLLAGESEGRDLMVISGMELSSLRCSTTLSCGDEVGEPDPTRAPSLQFHPCPSNLGPFCPLEMVFCGNRVAGAQKSMGTILLPVTFVDLTEKYESDEETR